MLATVILAAVFATAAPSALSTPASASPAPCALASPAAPNLGAPLSSARATCPSPAAALRTIGGTVTEVGRQVDLVGKAITASTGTIDQEQIATRPLLRPGEVLEAIPGLVISQHSGGGKANQYYLRGFQLDHGTNLDSQLNGIPVNLGSHAHGQGYSDINYLMPELVGSVEFKKGLYFADQGDFAVAGGYELTYRNEIEPTAEFTVGDFGYDRLFAAASPQVGAGKLLYAIELAHDNGSYVKPDEYHKFNGVLRYSRSHGPDDLAITALGYNGSFDSTDQIPQRLVDAGRLSRFGNVDPTDGGNTYRYALSAQVSHLDPNGVTKFDLYGVKSYLGLISNFTYFYDDANDYYNVTQNPVTCKAAYVSCAPNSGSAPRSNSYVSYCPGNDTAPAGAPPHSVPLSPFSFSCGDQRHQIDDRVYYGFEASRSFVTPRSETVVGVDLRNDNVGLNGLFLSHGRVDYANGTLSCDHITIAAPSAYVQSRVLVGSKLRVTGGLRFDEIAQGVRAFDPANSGRASEGVLDPKFALAFAASKHAEFYADYGESFHSNDARGVIGVDDPQTRAPFDPTGAPTQYNSPLTRASGEEVGFRLSTASLTTTVSAFRLLVANELVFDGDHGTTSIAGPDVREGIEFSNFFTPHPGLTFDADLATTTARFLTDPLHQGTGVPESLAGVVSAGATIDRPSFAASLRMRYFGPRVLDTQGDAVSPPSMLFNTQLTAKLRHRTALDLDVFNLLNARVADVTYFYPSWLKGDATTPALANDATVNPALGGSGVNDFHFHPSQARTVRVTLSTGL